MKTLAALLLVIAATLAPALHAAHPWDAHGRLRVSADGRTLQHADGTPFFLLADTAWHLRTLSPADLETYLRDRAEKKFNVVMADFHHGTKVDDAVPLSAEHWAKNDAMVDRAAHHGLYIIVIAGWGSSLRNYSPQRMHAYGRELGLRYKDRPNVIYWVAAEFYKIKRPLDDIPLTPAQQDHFDQLGRGIRAVNQNHLISIHGFPDKGVAGQPSTYYHRAEWCDFYSIQTHNFTDQIRATLSRDYALTEPVKPTFNAESGYEDCDKEIHAWLKQHAAVRLFDGGWGQRFQAYWSVFFGGFGYAYGHDYLWCMQSPDGKKNTLYLPALEAAGALSMRHLRALMEKRIAAAIPDQSIIVSDPGTDLGTDTAKLPDLRVATRDRNSTWALIYTTVGKDFTIDLAKLKGREVRARWFDPRDGTYRDAGRFPVAGQQRFDPPGAKGRECDWVLVLEASPAA
jgi:hypothetical protein